MFSHTNPESILASILNLPVLCVPFCCWRGLSITSWPPCSNQSLQIRVCTASEQPACYCCCICCACCTAPALRALLMPTAQEESLCELYRDLRARARQSSAPAACLGNLGKVRKLQLSQKMRSMMILLGQDLHWKAAQVHVLWEGLKKLSLSRCLIGKKTNAVRAGVFGSLNACCQSCGNLCHSIMYWYTSPVLFSWARAPF